jgi:alkylated DNA repair dioxygenase AlkB
MDMTTFLAGLPAARESLNRRLSLVRDLVQGVSRGYYPGLYLYGPPGTGKTYTVLKTLAAGGRLVRYHKGHITAIGLVELLEEYSNGVVVLDDVAEIFNSPVGLQIFLAALGRSPEDAKLPGQPNGRIVTYKRRGVEQRIVFTGGLVAISNLELHDTGLLGAIKSRSDCVQYDPTDQELAALMLDIADQGYEMNRPAPESGVPTKDTLSPEECREVAHFVIEQSLNRGCHLDLRVLVDKSFPKRLQHANGDSDNNWRDLVLLSLEERLAQPQHSPAVPAPPRGREAEVMRQLLRSGLGHAEQLARWKEITGRSPRAFYRWQARLGRRRDTTSRGSGSVSGTSAAGGDDGDGGVSVSGSGSTPPEAVMGDHDSPERRWESSGFRAQDLGDGCLFYVGRLTEELVWDRARFEDAWRLRPAERPVIRMLGRDVPITQHQQAYGKNYEFSGKTSVALPVPPLLLPLLAWAREAVDPRMNGLLLNWYQGPGEYIGPHHDSTKGMAEGAPILTLSFGETRMFRLTKKTAGGGGQKRDFRAFNGAAFVLPRDTNEVWKHAVPKSSRYQGRRISVTVRAFTEGE